MTDVTQAERFYVENPDWTYGRKLVVLASDYDKLVAQHGVLKEQLEREREKVADLQRTARIAKDRGRLTVVKS